MCVSWRWELQTSLCPKKIYIRTCIHSSIHQLGHFVPSRVCLQLTEGKDRDTTLDRFSSPSGDTHTHSQIHTYHALSLTPRFWLFLTCFIPVPVPVCSTQRQVIPCLNSVFTALQAEVPQATGSTEPRVQVTGEAWVQTWMFAPFTAQQMPTGVQLLVHLPFSHTHSHTPADWV